MLFNQYYVAVKTAFNQKEIDNIYEEVKKDTRLNMRERITLYNIIAMYSN